jgi:ADP-ribosylglycohydrolase
MVCEATKSVEVTHRHLEGIAGGVAIALAAAFAVQNRERLHDPAERRRLFDVVLDLMPTGETRDGVERAKGIEPIVSPHSAAGWLGNGRKVTCPDTVPFCLWAIAAFFTDYPKAVWETNRVGGDIDTTAAIVGGVEALATGREGIPAEWIQRREEWEYPAHGHE